MWTAHQYLSARDCHYNDDGSSRLAVSDTDRLWPIQYQYNTVLTLYQYYTIIDISLFFFLSFTTSTERLRSNIEMSELQILLDENSPGIPYIQSYHAKRMADIFLKTHGMVLDYSSIGKEVRFLIFFVSYGKEEKSLYLIFFFKN